MDPPKHKTHWPILLQTGVFFSFLLACFFLAQALATKIGTVLAGHHKVELHVDFKLSPETLLVSNQDRCDYEHLFLSLNEEYSCQVPRLAAGDSLRIPLAHFVSARGIPYAPATTTLRTVNLSTDTSQENYGSIAWLVPRL